MEQDRPGDGGQVQPRVQVLRQVEWMWQVRGQGGNSACRSWSGLVRVTRFRHSPVATRQDNMVDIGPRLGWEVNTRVRAQINGSMVWGAALSCAISYLAPILVDKPGGDVLRALPVPNFQEGGTRPHQHPTITTNRLWVSLGHLPILVGCLAKSSGSEKAFQSNELSFSVVLLSPFHHKPRRNLVPIISSSKWGQGVAFSFIP